MIRCKPMTLAAFAAALVTGTGACAGRTYPPETLPKTETVHYEFSAHDESRIEEFEDSFHDILAANTQRVRSYRDRFDTPVAYWVAYLSLPVQTAELRARAARYQWDHDRLEDELRQLQEKHADVWVFRIDFYAHNYDKNRIGGSERTPWQAGLLLPDGTRLVPTNIRKPAGSEEELRWLFPPHQRFAELYEVEFTKPAAPFPADQAAILEITGLLDTSSTNWHLGRDAPAPQTSGE